MNRRVVLTISGLHAGENEDNGTVETIVEAEYFEKNGSHYILYEEQEEGFTQTSKNRIKFKDNLVELIRQGVVGTHMIFEKGKTHMTDYQTPFGQMLLGINTGSLEVQMQEESIYITIEYVLEADGEYLSDSRIEITLRNAE